MKKINLNLLKPHLKKEAIWEVQIMKNLKSPHVIKYYISFMEEQNLYIIMEYAEQGDLYRLLKLKRE